MSTPSAFLTPPVPPSLPPPFPSHSPTAAAAHFGCEAGGPSTCCSAADSDIDQDCEAPHRATAGPTSQQGGWARQVQPPFPRPLQQLLLPATAAAAAAGGGAGGIPAGVKMEEVAGCVLQGSAQQVAEVSD
jgi:hypothetical protein